MWAGVLLRLAFEMRPGDLVVHPCKADATLSFGRVAGEYSWDPDAPPDNRHRRAVEWLEVGVPRIAEEPRAMVEGTVVCRS